MDWSSLVSSRSARTLVVISGMVLAAIGLVLGRTQQNTAQVTLVEPSLSPASAVEEKNDIIVDVAGAVEQPGVYALPEGTRVEDALVKAGGFTTEADTAYITKFINRAQVLTDGAKVYIPALGETESLDSQAVFQPASQGEVIGLVSSEPGRINVNAATQAELETLWGIGAARAEAIMAHRPFATLDELKTKANIPQNVLDRNADGITF